MPELPEVETTRRGLEPLLVGQSIANLAVREPRLRWPVDPSLPQRIRNERIASVKRRGKYLLIATRNGSLIWHLGMSGSLRYLDEPGAPDSHDHLDLVLSTGACVRFNDPRRFGSLHFSETPESHWLLSSLGPEPLSDDFSGAYLRRTARGRRVAIKQHIMNSRIVTGVGNIYASEALFRSRVHPRRAAGRISLQRLDTLATSIKHVLNDAIHAGGTTLRDFVGGDGRPGYFQQTLAVYGRGGEPCIHCQAPIKQVVLGQRATYYCPRCQR
ncbi:MAG: bifunctional DNA-formamidopyrimidine glycosylase/DNA-(apurinic or apyrimidinic site) lyase [Gammaproteobacteria bacterium]|nr:bifunctional DNA-formamidopyrimidine glycosylase/DNA-(apurinic or apyrimidinic site) lyase [Gammaproteobacteria bacterium]